MTSEDQSARAVSPGERRPFRDPRPSVSRRVAPRWDRAGRGLYRQEHRHKNVRRKKSNHGRCDSDRRTRCSSAARHVGARRSMISGYPSYSGIVDYNVGVLHPRDKNPGRRPRLWGTTRGIGEFTRHSYPRIHTTMPFEDMTIVCSDCNTEFVHSAEDQERYAERGFTNNPKRCRECREKRKQQSRGGGGGGESS